MNAGLFALLQDFDRKRPALSGENLIKLGLGAAMLRGGVVSKIIGATLIYRAFQGKDGLTQILKGERGPRYAANDSDVSPPVASLLPPRGAPRQTGEAGSAGVA